MGEKERGNRRHRGKEFGTRNGRGERIANFVDTHNLVCVMVYQTIVSYSYTIFDTGNSKTQIDYIVLNAEIVSLSPIAKSFLIRPSHLNIDG